MRTLNKELSASGVLVSSEGLADPKQAKAVRAGKDGAPITDGVFPEAKDFLPATGSSMSKVPSMRIRLPHMASAAPGPGGAPINMRIEVRQVLSGMPEEFL